VVRNTAELNLHTELQTTREIESYLQRGRAHKDLTVDELNSRWVSAFRMWFGSRGAEDTLGYYDLDIELELRGLEPPGDAIQAVFARARAQLRASFDESGSMASERVVNFLRAAS
jgi:hypothetical protein